jgi:hypothetical protein
MRSRGGGLLAGYAAADCIEFEAGVLGSFDRAPHGLADERGHFDSALFDV